MKVTEILFEKARAAEALRFLDYERDEHDELVSKIKSRLKEEWQSIVKQVKDVKDDELKEKRPNMLFSSKVDDSQYVINKSGERCSVNLSVKLAGALDKDTRNSLKKQLMSKALEIFKEEANSLIAEGKRNPFRVHQEDSLLGEIKLSFVTGDHNKPIMMIGSDETSNYSRIYFCNLLRK